MKRLAILGAALLCAAFSLVAHAQTLCDPPVLAQGAASYSGPLADAPPSVTIHCAGSSTVPDPVVCTAPQVRDPATNTCVTPVDTQRCEDQTTEVGLVGAKRTLKRQCSGIVYMQPTSAYYSGPLTDLGTVLGKKTFPNFAYIGAAPTFMIRSGYYVTLAFTPQTTGYVQLVANSSYGDGGTISLSTKPGAFGKGADGVVCSLANNGLNSLLATTANGVCKLTLGTTYYFNFADVDSSGNDLCNGYAPCSDAYVAYTLYGRPL